MGIAGQAISGLLGANAATSVANTQSNAAMLAAMQQQAASRDALDVQRFQWQVAQNNMAPWLQAGQNALARQTAGTAPGGEYDPTQWTVDKYSASPYYQWLTQQGVNALQASGAAAGNYGSGNLGAALVEYGQNMAGAGFQDWWNRMMQAQSTAYNQQAGISGTGQTTGNALTSAGQNYATTASNTMLGGANALASGLNAAAASQAQGLIGSAGSYANALSGADNQAAGILGAFLRNQQFQNMMNQYQMNLSSPVDYNTFYGGGGTGYADLGGM